MNMTVNDLAAEIKRQQAMKKDFLARSWDGFQMDPDGTHLEIEGLSRCRLRDYAHGDLGQFTEIPKPYYDRMRRDMPTSLNSHRRGKPRIGHSTAACSRPADRRGWSIWMSTCSMPPTAIAIWRGAAP